MDDALLLPCTQCQAMNRIAADRLGQAPNCGRCHEPLFTAKPMALTAANFDLHALRSGLPLLVDFWAPWCGPCRTMAPQFEAAAKILEPRMRLAKLDTEAEPALGARFNIRSISTLVLFRNGQEAARSSGALGSGQIVQWVNAALAS